MLTIMVSHCVGGGVVQSPNHARLLQPNGLQHARLPCPSLSPKVCSNSCPLNHLLPPTPSAGRTEEEVVGWNHWFHGRELGQTGGDGEGQRSLVCCSPWGRKESDTTRWLSNKIAFKCVSLKISSSFINLATTHPPSQVCS